MAVKYGKKKHRQNNIFYTVVTVFLLSAVFLSMVGYFYSKAEDEAYEMLHIQTKQIKDDLHLQAISDRENLATMANFAAKLYNDGESYNLMFDSFKPIGLIDNIGILMPDNTFVTKAGSINLDGLISFEKEKEKGEYISGRLKDLTTENVEIIRSAVPINADGRTVGILYGVIKLDTIGRRYSQMAKDLDAQLFIYDKESGNLVVDTVHKKPGNISFLKERKYHKGYSYEQMMENDKGFISFVSAYTGEDLYVHYSTIEDLDWMITLARYESQVFADTHQILKVLIATYLAMVSVMILYMLILMKDERRRGLAITCASRIRKTLLEINQQQNNLSEALKQICLFAKARSAIFIDTDGDDYNFIMPSQEENALLGDDRRYFMSELFRYAAENQKINTSTVNVMCIKPNEHLVKTNPDFYRFFKEHKIREVSFATVTSKNNHITILGTINPAKSDAVRLLAEDVAVCFSIALYNKKHLNKTELAATTDSLTGVMNRVSYKKDILLFDEERPIDFSCIYIDVNELHLRNNKYGHAAGDEMLIYIANTLKEVFFGHSIYRMGGDEFLVFAENTKQDIIRKHIDDFMEQLKPMNYHVAIGMSYRSQNTNCDEMVREAEIRMYEAKALYYQNKEQSSVSKVDDNRYVQTKTGIREIDTMISVLKEHYNGIYRVSLETDSAHRILMPSYLGYEENERNFSKLFTKYINEIVDPDFRRGVMNFLNYEAIQRQLSDKKIPKISYKKMNGEMVILSVYKLNENPEDVKETLWVFAKD